MNRLQKLLSVFFCLALTITLTAQDFTIDAEGIEVTNPVLEQKFFDYDVFSISSAAFKQKMSATGQAHDFVLNLGEMTVHAEMIPSDLRSKDYILQVQTETGVETFQNTGNKVFKGFVKNDRNGLIKLVVDDYFIYGTFEVAGEKYFIEPVHLLTEGPVMDQYIIYKESDARPIKDVRCAADDLEHNQIKQLHGDHPDGESSENRSVGECYKVEHAIASDFSMFNFYGSVVAVENRNLGVLNNMQGNYDNEFDDEIEFAVVTQFVSNCSNCDPWTSATDSELLLNSFTNWGNSGGFGGVQFDLGSLWSRRNFDGSTIGLAWVSGLCTNLKYHVLEDFSANAQFLRVLWAHEIGHNFSALHDAQGSNTIMAPSVNGATAWSTNSQTQINNLITQRANQGNCFSNCGGLPTVDIQAINPDVCTGGQIVFFDDSESQPEAFDWFWEFDGGTPDQSSDRNPIVTYNTPGTYSVTLTVTNALGSSTETFSGFVEVSGGGSDILLYNDFQDGIEWNVDNPDGDKTWETIQVGGLFFGEFAARVDNFNYTATGARDAMITPEFSLMGRASAQLNLTHAHKRFNTTQDSLIVYVSTDGGSTFPNKVFADAENGSGNFATGTDQNTLFIPDNTTDWCFDGFFGADCISVDLSQFAGEENIVLRIENYNNFGNAIYLGLVYVEAACFAVDPPVADFIGAPNEGCAPLLVNFTDLSTNFPESWIWSFPGGIPETSTDPNPSILYEVPGTYPVTLTVNNTAGQDELTLTDYITVGTVPATDFIFTINGSTVTFINQTTGADSYLWEFGDGNTSMEENPEHTYAEDGEYLVELTATNDCGDLVYNELLMISAQPTAGFTADVSSGCAPLTVEFTDTSSENTTMWQWIFEGGTPAMSNDTNPTVVYNSAGAFDVTLIAQNADGSDTLVMEDMIDVGAPPVADFGFEIDLNTVNFSDSTAGADSIRWHFGDGGTSTMTNPEYTYANDGMYTVILIGYNACGTDTATAEIIISSEASANVAADSTTGCAPFTVQFSDSNSVNVETRLWIFEGGTPGMSSVSNPTVVYANPGSYNVTLIVSNAVDSDTAVFEDYIVVSPLPHADFDYELEGNTVMVSDSSENTTTWNWNFGDGTTSMEQNPEHTYNDAGNYVIILIASNDCGADTTSRNVSVGSGAPVADFESDLIVCPEDVVAFDNLSSSNATTFAWIFEGGAPAASSDEAPMITYNTPGVYDVQLIASNAAGSDTILKMNYITVLENPTADFDYNGSGLEINFVSTSTDVVGVSWDFGDGGFSTELNPTYTYDAVGTYSVTHIVYGVCDTVMITEDVLVQLAPQSGFTANETDGCAPMMVQFMNETIGNVDSFEWIFEGGTPAMSNEENPMVTYETPGIYDVTLVVSNNSGSNTLVQADYVTIGGAPVADFMYSADADSVSFTNLSIDADSYLWQFGDGSTSSDANPSHLYGASGEWEVTLIATNECGSDTLVVGNVVDVVDLESDIDLHIYPVPADDFLLIDINSSSRGAHGVRIMDMFGRTAMQVDFEKHSVEHQVQLPVSNLAPATYFLEITTDRTRIIRKIVIQ